MVFIRSLAICTGQLSIDPVPGRVMSTISLLHYPDFVTLYLTMLTFNDPEKDVF